MKKSLSLGVTALMLTCFSTAAEARRGVVPSGWYESTSFVAETQMPGVSLCHLVKKHHIAYLPYSIESGGYVLAEDQCKAETFWVVPTEKIIEMKTNGVLDLTIPNTPVMSLREKIQGGLLWGVVGLGGMLVVAAKLGGRTGLGKGRKRRGRSSKATNARMLAAMCQVAKCDGTVEVAEITTIVNTVKHLTGMNVGVNEVAEIIHNTDLYNDLPHLSALGEGLYENDRRAVVEAALTVAVSDGQIAPQEYSFIRDLANAMEIKADEFRFMLRQIAGNLAPQGA